MADPAVDDSVHETEINAAESDASDSTTSLSRSDVTTLVSWEKMTAARAKARLMDDANKAIHLYPESFLKETRRYIGSIFAAKRDCRKFSQHPMAVDVDLNLYRAVELLDQGCEPSSRQIQSLLPDRALLQALRVSGNGSHLLVTIVQNLFSLGEMHLLMPPGVSSSLSNGSQIGAGDNINDQRIPQMDKNTSDILSHMKDLVEETVRTALDSHSDSAVQSAQEKLHETYRELEMALMKKVEGTLWKNRSSPEDQLATKVEPATIKEDPRWAIVEKLADTVASLEKRINPQTYEANVTMQKSNVIATLENSEPVRILDCSTRSLSRSGSGSSGEGSRDDRGGKVGSKRPHSNITGAADDDHPRKHPSANGVDAEEEMGDVYYRNVMAG
ncbi:hypothetical protein PT974_10837 [Cladobotryum mycophilum]|uniref:Uncharacterized protein n=1 Tax=Cladobotryum mycophilum TaxID=491253 RepID=A0ABR0SAX5_9HYPO